ncbi:MAG: hypothetical protein ABRQ31_11610 [Smithellaceae bacterium]
MIQLLIYVNIAIIDYNYFILAVAVDIPDIHPFKFCGKLLAHPEAFVLEGIIRAIDVIGVNDGSEGSPLARFHSGDNHCFAGNSRSNSGSRCCCRCSCRGGGLGRSAYNVLDN